MILCRIVNTTHSIQGMNEPQNMRHTEFLHGYNALRIYSATSSLSKNSEVLSDCLVAPYLDLNDFEEAVLEYESLLSDGQSSVQIFMAKLLTAKHLNGTLLKSCALHGLMVPDLHDQP